MDVKEQALIDIDRALARRLAPFRDNELNIWLFAKSSTFKLPPSKKSVKIAHEVSLSEATESALPYSYFIRKPCNR